MFGEYGKYIKTGIIGLFLIVVITWIAAYGLDIKVLRYVAGSLTLALIVIGFLYANYLVYKFFIKKPKEESDERKKYNFSRASRNAYLFIILFWMFVLPLIFTFYKDCNIHWIYSISFYISIAIGIISFLYYDMLGK